MSIGPHPFNSYFHDKIEYPKPCESMVPLGVLYEYISSDFLNGWLNYVDIKSIRLISRYEPFADNQKDVQALIESNPAHTDLSESLHDDTFILAQAGGHWWFFWYDRDCSDCCIGRFQTTDSNETVLAAFADYADDRSKNMGYEHSGSPAIEIPLQCMKGWLRG